MRDEKAMPASVAGGHSDRTGSRGKGKRRGVGSAELQLEGIRRVAVIMLPGAREEKAASKIAELRKERKDLVFDVVSEPDEISADTEGAKAELVVFVANGTTEGAERFLARADDEGITTLLVSEHRDDSDRFDHQVDFNAAIGGEWFLVSMNVAFLQRNSGGEFFCSLLPSSGTNPPTLH